MKLPKWREFSKIGAKGYIGAFCITVLLALVLLVMSAFLPQYLIQQHVADSVDLVYFDLENNYLFDRSIGSKLDVFTDIMMLRTSLTTNDRYLGSVLTNPVYVYNDLEEWEGSAKTLARLSYDEPSDGVWFYTRYWMGFRVVLRLALTFFTYGQIKRYLATLFLGLFAAVLCSVSKHANSRIAFFFALSIVLIRPHVMATSMQLTCCFFLAFAAMLLIPRLQGRTKWEALFFMELGMLTMYFDFYTVPLITLGFPLMYLSVLEQEKNLSFSWKHTLGDMTAWFLGYGGMWLTKLGLTSLLTSEHALRDGFQSLLTRTGIQKDAARMQNYSVQAAFRGIREAVFSDELGTAVYLLCAGVILAAVLWKVLKGHVSRKAFRMAAPYLFFAVLPLIWFVITREPVSIHYFFQYRTIALTHWAAGVFLHYLLCRKHREQMEP